VAPGAPAAEWELKLLPLAEMGVAVPAADRPAPAASNTPSGFRRAELKESSAAPSPEPEPPAAPGEFGPAPAEGFLINGSVNNGAASPFAQAAAFGNNRIKRSLYNASLGMTFGSSALDARAFSLTGQDMPKPAYTRTQGMLSLGGPLKIPRLVPRNGPDVTVNYQWTRNTNATATAARVPTPEERTGDFSRSVDAMGRPVVPLDPANGSPFPGGTVPQSRISPQAAALAALYPLPNFVGGARYNYQVPLTGATHQDSLQTRVTQQVGRRNTLAGRFGFESTRADSTNLFGFLDTTETLGIDSAANWTHRFGARAFLTLGWQYSRLSNRSTPSFAGRSNISGSAGIRGNLQDAADWGPPALTFSSGIATLSDALYSFTRYQTSGARASVFWSHREHNITAGADFRRQQVNQLGQQDPRGGFAFTGAAAGSDFAGFLLGIPDTASLAYGNADKYFRAGSWDAYFADDWRATASLTINAGLRWEYNTPITELNGRLVNLDIAPGYAAVAPVTAGAAGPLTGRAYPDSLVDPYRRAWQPRIGISWRPFAASPLIVRAGYGVYYDSSVYPQIATRMAQQPPLSRTLSVANSAATPLTLADGFLAAPVLGNTFAVDPGFRPGYAQNWQLSVQRDLPLSTVLTASYLGIKGTHGQQQFLPNTAPAGAPQVCPGCPAGFVELASNGNSTRHSGQVQLRRRLRAGFAAQADYTFSKSIDDAALGGRGQAAAVIAQDWLNLRGERGLSPFDQRHLLSVQAQYTGGMGLGGGTLLGGWRARAFQDWTLATQIKAASGLPQTPVYFAAVNGTGVTGSLRPDYTGASLYAAPPGLFLNPVAVAPPASGRWGDAGRNTVGGPAQFSLNASLARTFRVNDRASADFRLDASNALNHVVYSAWNVTYSPQFGLPSAANAMRSLQATLRVRF
jgi:hypothetical protein